MNVVITVIVAFASGVVGSALGAVGAVVMTAVMALVGLVGNICGSDINLVNEIAFGMFLGPQVSFGPACCAAAYAKRRGYLESSKDIFTPLISLNHHDTLLVGGAFAVLGWYVNTGISALIPGKIDSVALTVMVISIIAKVMFGGDGLRAAVGRVPKGAKRYSLFCKQVWLPYQTAACGVEMLLIGGCVGGISGYVVQLFSTISQETGNMALADASIFPIWAIAVICFLLNASGLSIPVFHHIGLVAGYAAQMVFNAGAGPERAILWGVAFGILSVYMGDLLAKTFMVFGEGFVDPPSMAIAVCSILPLWLLPLLGIDSPDNILNLALPIIIIAVGAMIGIYQEKKFNSYEAKQCACEGQTQVEN